MIVKFIEKNKINLQKIQGVAVVTGPGSFTALRTILSITNTILMVHEIKVLEIKNNKDLGDEDLFEQAIIKLKKGGGSTKFVKPHYDKKPNISFAKSKF